MLEPECYDGKPIAGGIAGGIFRRGGLRIGCRTSDSERAVDERVWVRIGSRHLSTWLLGASLLREVLACRRWHWIYLFQFLRRALVNLVLRRPEADTRTKGKSKGASVNCKFVHG